MFRFFICIHTYICTDVCIFVSIVTAAGVCVYLYACISYECMCMYSQLVCQRLLPQQNSSLVLSPDDSCFRCSIAYNVLCTDIHKHVYTAIYTNTYVYLYIHTYNMYTLPNLYTHTLTHVHISTYCLLSKMLGFT